MQDISVLIAKRLKAVKKLKKNPDDKKTKDKIDVLDKKVGIFPVDHGIVINIDKVSMNHGLLSDVIILW